MHDCMETKERLTELALDSVDGHQDEVLLTELNKCAECRAEFDALNATLRITTRLRVTAAPAESYWVGYHTKLREKIQLSAKSSDAKAQRRKVQPMFFLAPLRLCVRATVPVPVALIVAVVFAAIGLIAIQGARQPAPQSPLIVHVPVEVPVPQEKIVTRVVYRERRSRARTSKKTISAPPKVESTFAKFKPSDEVKLTVIKGGYRQ